MSNLEKSIDVNVPAHTAYNQWTQFEEFPKFMDGVVSIRQLDDKRTHWVTNLGGKETTFDAEITEQIPDKRIAWRSLSGAPNAGVVTFHPLNSNTTRIMLQIDYEPKGIVENAGDMLGIAGHRVKADLERFKAFIESKGAGTEGWRGEIKRDA